MSRIFRLDLLAPVFVLIFFSLTTLISLDFTLFRNQLIFTFLGLIAFTLFSLIDYRALKQFMMPILIFSVIILYVVLVVGIEARGAARWLELGGLRIQMSEILKPFLLISLSSFLISGEGKISWWRFFMALLVMGIIVLPIFLQPDLGNAVIYLFSSALIFVFFGIPLLWLAIPTIFLVLISPLFWKVLHDYQKLRIMSFLNPTSDPLGSSYNLMQSMIAIGGGEFFGRGLGSGTQSLLKFLPERHTDFIFATIAENFGFVGALLVLGTFVFLLIRIYDISRHCDDSFAKILSGGAFFILLVHIIINIGGNVGLLPITGITLPLVSYGGSSLLSTFILLGIVNSIASIEQKDPKVLEIR